MLLSKKNGTLLLFFVTFAVLLGSSCSKENKQNDGVLTSSNENKQSGGLWDIIKKPFDPNKKGPIDPDTKKRIIAIVNQTGCDIKYFRVSVADGELIFAENKFPLDDENGTVKREIQPAYRNHLELEIRLVDKYDRIYARSFQVPLSGKTPTPIKNSDRVSEGFLTDKKKDFFAFMNGGCQ
jgi:hypothetical protein